MYVIKELLSDLEHSYQENPNEHVSESEIYEFIIDKIDYKGIADTLSYFYMRLAAASIAQELIRQDDYGSPDFDESYIFDLLIDNDDEEYLQIYRYYFGKLKFLEHHTINGETYFFGDGLKIKYDVFIKMFSIIITQELNTALEKVKKILNAKVDITEWSDVIIGGNSDYLDIEIERMEGIVNGVIG